MGVEIRLPNITGTTEKEQLLQLKSYLYQLSEQLQWAFDNINTTGGSGGQGGSTVVLNPVRGGNTSSGGSSGNTDPAFNELKALIIKTADTVDAYYEETKREFNSVYEAQSVFGDFIETNEQTIIESATGVKQLFTNVQAIDETLNGDEEGKTGIVNTVGSLERVTAYINSGELYKDSNDLPVYGLEIGQRNGEGTDAEFKAFARFTADRLSFYDSSGQEVAYVSNQQLYIPYAEVTKELQIGGYRDYIDADGGIVTKWVGGS